MKYILITFILIANLCFSVSSFAKDTEQSLDQMVAVVNDDLITRSELNDAIQSMKLQITSERVSAPSEKALEKQVLEQLINKRLQLQFASQNGIKTTTAELDKAIKGIAQQNNVPVNELYKRVQEEGITKASYRKEIREQITLQKLQQKEVAGKVTVSPEEVSSFMESANFMKNSSREYRIHDILIPTSDTPSSKELAAAKERADFILKKLRRGEQFSKIAKEQSRGKNALQGGDLGWRKLPEVPSAFASAVVDMKKNDLAGPIKASNGFHIVLLSDVRKLDASNKTLADRKTVRSMLLRQKFEQAIQNWVSKLRSQAFIVAS